MQDEAHLIKVGISIGDLNGIGCEVILKTFEDARMLELCTPVIFASTKTLNFYRNHLGIELNFQGISNANQAIDGKINVVNVWKEAPEISFGNAAETGGKYAVLSLKAAVRALKENQIDVLVTAPINKKTVQSDQFNFPGHTDYLAKELEGESLMFMVTENLKVGLLTDHVPVKDAPSLITSKRIIAKVKAMEESLIKDFGINRPKIAVLGINPHSGDDGVIGSEDDEVLKPTLKRLSEKRHLVFGPFSADTFFASDQYLQYDGILASYHDQGLIPFKTLSFGKGVNFTAGLSRVRTSPDHGTAFDIAGKGTADPSSFREAIYTAIQVFRNRVEFEHLNSNPLPKIRLKRSSKDDDNEK